MKQVKFLVDEELLEKLDRIAERKGLTRSQAIRKAIELWVQHEEKKLVPKPKIVRLTS